MLVVTDAQFKSNPQAYLDRVDEGEEVLLQRSEGQRYLIIPAQDLERAISLDEFREGALQHIRELYRRKA